MTTTERPTPQIAIYWDFENIHIALCEEENGPRSYVPRERQPALVDVADIVGFASTEGSVCVNRAYCNWAYMDRYADALASHAIELVQMWPRGGSGKNGADIQMCVDIMEDLQRHPHVDTFIIVSGDSDFIGVLSKLKQYGKRVIGIGVRGAVHRLVIKVCDEFKFYDTLLVADASGHGPGRMSSEQGLPGAKRLLTAALQRLAAQSGVPRVKQAGIKPMMLRIESAFDERSFGFANFTAFLDACRELLEIMEPGDGSGRIISLKQDLPQQISPEQAKARKLLVAAMTFLSRKNPLVSLSSLKPQMQRLEPEFDETKLGFLAFLAFVRRFPDAVRIEGDNERRTLQLVCPPDEGGYTAPVAAAVPRPPFVLPPDAVLAGAHHYHWNTLRQTPARDWNEYFAGLEDYLGRQGIAFDEGSLKSVQTIIVGAKVLRPKVDNVGITLRTDFADEAAFLAAVSQHITKERTAAAAPAP